MKKGKGIFFDTIVRWQQGSSIYHELKSFSFLYSTLFVHERVIFPVKTITWFSSVVPGLTEFLKISEMKLKPDVFAMVSVSKVSRLDAL